MSYLCLAILFEIIATVLMKISDGFANIPASIGMVAAYILCFLFAGLSLKYMEIGFFYATWSAVCIIALAIIGALFFHESLTVMKIASTVLIVIGVIGFNLSGQS